MCCKFKLLWNSCVFLLSCAMALSGACSSQQAPEEDPCDTITCSGHGTCAIAGQKAICACDKGFHAEDLECVADEVENPCREVSCSNHGGCVISEGQPFCLCEVGYHSEDLECVENDVVDPCNQVDCSGHGSCRTDGNDPYCDCDEGYFPVGLTCVDQQDPCMGIECSGHGTCETADDGSPFCNCNEGYHARELECVENDNEDPCVGVTCSNHGTCEVDEAGNLFCNCDDGYHEQDLNCIMDDTDPCSGISCSGHGSCFVAEGVPACECDPGYHQQGLACVVDAESNQLPIWFLHITDCHFGESATASALTTAFVDEIVPVIDPVASINTGDVTDGGSSFQWRRYLDSITNAPEYPYFFEIPGNHDKKTDDGQPFLTYSVTGRAGAGFFGLTQLDSSVGSVRIVRVDTSDSSINAVNIAGVLGNDQADQILDLISSDSTDPSFSIVAAHHPMVGPERLRLGSSKMQDIVDQSGADIYLCGHTHRADIAWLGNTLHVTGPSVGKTDPTTYSLVSIDNTGPGVRLIELTSNPSWPVVMITSPTDSTLGSHNPRAAQYSIGQTIEVRAIAFAPTSLQQVEIRVGDGEWEEMSVMREHVFHAEVTLPQAAGQVVLTARATGSGGTDLHEITVEVQ